MLAALLVYRYDMYEREPWFMIVLAVGLGWAAMWLAGLAESWTLDRFGEVPRPDVIEAAVAATLPPAEIIRVTGHLVMGGITGFAIGMARMSMKGWPFTLLRKSNR